MLLFDCETDGFLEFTTTLHCVVIYDTDTDQYTLYDEENFPVEDAVERLMHADCIVAHNAFGFDVPALRKLYPWFKPQGAVKDTLPIGRLLWPNLKETDFDLFRKKQIPGKLIGSHSLEAWGYRFGEYKDDYQKDNPDRFKEWDREMSEYCVQDVVVLKTLWDRIQNSTMVKSGQYDRALELENYVQYCIARQMNHGWLFDEKAAQELHIKLLRRREEIVAELQRVFPPWYEPKVGKKLPFDWDEYEGYEAKSFTPKKDLNSPKRGLFYKAGCPLTKIELTEFKPSSTMHIAKALKRRYQWEPTAFTPNSGEPSIDETVLDALPYPEAPLLAEYLMVNKRLGQLAEGEQAWLKKLGKDGRIHGYVNTMGTVTGRMTHSHPNVAQVPASRSPFGHECRSLFTVRPGYRLVGCDASSLELRCLAHFMGFHDGGEYRDAVVYGSSKDGTDPHSRNRDALQIDSRDAAKTWFYAFIYGAGDGTLGAAVGVSPEEIRKWSRLKKWEKTRRFLQNRRKDPIPNPTDTQIAEVIKGGILRQNFLKNLPALKKLTEGVQAKAKAQGGWLRGLDGRYLRIRSAHAALNAVLQSAGALIMKMALMIADKELQEVHGLIPFGEGGDDYEWVGNIHDELQAEVKEEHAKLVGETIRQGIQKAGEAFNLRCPMDGEYDIGSSWAETH